MGDTKSADKPAKKAASGEPQDGGESIGLMEPLVLSEG
jgi:hypothetical protein